VNLRALLHLYIFVLCHLVVPSHFNQMLGYCTAGASNTRICVSSKNLFPVASICSCHFWFSIKGFIFNFAFAVFCVPSQRSRVLQSMIMDVFRSWYPMNFLGCFLYGSLFIKMVAFCLNRGPVVSRCWWNGIHLSWQQMWSCT